MLSESDIDSLVYFWKEKRDLTRWVGWNERIGDIEKELPQLVYAVRQLEIMEKIIDAIIEGL